MYDNELNTNDLEERIEALQEELRDLEDEEQGGSEQETELEELLELKNQMTSADWDAGTYLYSEESLKTYAIGHAETLYGDLADWPLSCIDWDEATDELKNDFSAYELGGETYYGRE